MSRDFNILCRPCNETHHFNDANHRSDLMRNIINHANQIADLHSLFQDDQFCIISLDTSYGRIDTSWFVKHRHHELVVVDEYGRTDDQCVKYITCKECETQHSCKLHRDHNGDCSPIAPDKVG
jgi:hypothetical protein